MSELRERLRNLRAVRRPIEPIRYEAFPPDSDAPQPLEALAPGEVFDTPHGKSYVVRTNHTPDHSHGSGTLHDWLGQNLSGAAAFTNDSRLAQVAPDRCVFLDTETTGLNAGAGTLVFLVGLGLFTESGFEVRQYFLRDPGEEPAMLHAIREVLDGCDALVTFNGRSFDMPLLDARYVINRQHLPVSRWPNLDLLFPARRLWKRRLQSCRLVALETAILGVRRAGQDVPGWLIPQLYHEYLATGDARQMSRVMYHNLYDVLSMVTLATTVCQTFAQSYAPATIGPAADTLPQDDLLSLARWYESLGKVQEAEGAYQSALRAARHENDQRLCLQGLANLFKRQERLAEAEPLWQTLVALSPGDPDPCLELAKYHEWSTHELGMALIWTDAALQANARRNSPYLQQMAAQEIARRRERLLRKLGKVGPDSQASAGN
ncbi:MAG TPA: ribonuclease H-like domain-containing protein [Aggregatilineales bacterium]|nr:ribonuclease H-like domain-containing protein [Aggregatilineales bacterium]